MKGTGKKKASSTAYDSEEPTEQEMSVRNMYHVFFFTHMIAVLPLRLWVSCCLNLQQVKAA